MASVFGRKFLGYSFWVAPGGVIKRKVAAKPLATFKQRIRQLTRRRGGRSMAGCGGSSAALCAGMEGILPAGANTKGLARAGPMAASPVARHPAQAVEARHDHVQGIAGAGGQPELTRNGWRPTAAAGGATARAPQRRVDPGVLRPAGNAPSLMTSTSRTARCGPACRVVWQGRGRQWSPPMPIGDEPGDAGVEPAADASIKAPMSGWTCDLFPLSLRAKTAGPESSLTRSKTLGNPRLLHCDQGPTMAHINFQEWDVTPRIFARPDVERGSQT